MADGLSINDIVSVSINLSPTAAQGRDFGALLILGSTADVISVSERMRRYSSITEIAADFGTSAPEYLAARNFFAQSPRPSYCYLGRWARTASKAQLFGAVRSTAQQALSNFTGITSGGFAITIDGTVRTLSSLNFSAATTLSGVAAIVDTALSTWADCSWNAAHGRFEIISTTTGASSTLAAVTSTATSLALGIYSGTSISNGIAAETLLAGVTAIAALSTAWYGLIVADTNPVAADHQAVAAFIEAAAPARIYGVTTQDANALVAAATTDIAYLLAAALYRRSFVQYSSSDPYAVAAMYGRAFTVNFAGNNTTITLKFKQEPGITPETLSASAAAALRAKKCNVFVNYNNSTAIIQEGVMSDGSFFDEVHGLDWLSDSIQTALYNALYTSATKIPQTEAGINILVAVVEQVCGQAVQNGLLGPGTWSVDGFGQLARGDYLPKGFYVYSAPLATQLQADREARRAPVMQVAAKMAGAVHSASVIINVNR